MLTSVAPSVAHVLDLGFVQVGEAVLLGLRPEGDKVMRMNAQTGRFEQGLVYLPQQAPWLEDYRRELISFPQGKHDDQVDSTAQALKWIHEAGQEPGLLRYYREMAERMRARGEIP